MKNVRLKAIISLLENLEELLLNVREHGISDCYDYYIDRFYMLLHSYLDIGLINICEYFDISDYIYMQDYVGAVKQLHVMGVSDDA